MSIFAGHSVRKNFQDRRRLREHRGEPLEFDNLKIAWITRSFLDYRIPVFRELDKLAGERLFLIFSSEYVPSRVAEKARSVLRKRAIAMTGEWRLGREDREFMANRNVSLRLQPGIRSKIRELQPDVMVCDGFFKWTFQCLLERRWQGTPLVVCCERTAHTERNAQWYRRLYRSWALKGIDAMCCNGKLTAEYLISLGWPPDLVTCGQMAADTETLAEACEAVTPADTKVLDNQLGLNETVFLYVGRMIQFKGLNTLIKAWAMLDSTVNAEVSLLLVGDGPERAGLERLCRERELKNVRFAGAVDYDQIARYYALADALVIPTLEDNWSLVVPEAMACGLPVMCSKYNGCWPELVKEGKNGWVFDPLETQDILRALHACLDARDRLTTMGAESQRIVSHFTPEKAAQSIFEACKIALGKRASSINDNVIYF